MVAQGRASVEAGPPGGLHMPVDDDTGGRGFPNALPPLTSLRFLLALGVVLFHYQLQWPWDTMAVTGLVNRARLGVDVFFILSGFVLTHAYRHELAAGAFSFRRFMLARFARIYPGHLAVLAFVIAMVAAASLVGADFDRKLYNPAGLVASVLLVQAWFPAGVVVAEWNGPSWSLSAEWFAYLAFPAFAWVGLKLRRQPIVLLALALAMFLVLDLAYQALYRDVVVHAEANLGILRIAPEFLIGVALYRLGERIEVRAMAASLLAAACFTLLLLLMHFKADDRVIAISAGPLILSLALLSKAGVDGALSKPWMLAAGEASFALYILHFPLLIAWKGVNASLTDRASSYIFAAWEVPCLLALTLAASFALHYGWEAPARRILRNWATKARSPIQRRRVKLEAEPTDS